jgi:peptidoglycan/LPS O-acetylase OafA/YrhL
MTDKQYSRRRLEGVDVLRAFAILAVFGHHLFFQVFLRSGLVSLGWHGPWKVLSAVTHRWIYVLYPLYYGGLGVTLFFVISGFCIQSSFVSGAQQMLWRSYFLRRFFRIYPPYLVALALSVAMLSCESAFPGWRQIASHVAMVQNLQGSTFFGINPSFWSLAVEWQLYIAYPLFLVFLRVGGMTVLLMVSCLASLAASFWGGQPPDAHGLLWTQLPFFYWFSWGSGAIVAELWRQGRIPRWKMGRLSLLLGSLGVLLTEYHPLQFLSGAVFVLCFSALLILYLRRSECLCSWERLLLPLGACSYSFYLIHQVLLERFLAYWESWSRVRNFALELTVGGGVAFLCILLVAWLFYRFIEKPSHRLGMSIDSRIVAKNLISHA